MDTQVLAGYGVDARGFYAEAMRLWQMRLRSIGYLDERLSAAGLEPASGVPRP